MSTDETHTLCYYDQAVLEEYRQKFYVTLGKELRANARALPCCFAMLVVEPGFLPNEARFNAIVVSVPELLPKGREEAESMLLHLLRQWEERNYPDKAQQVGQVGTA